MIVDIDEVKALRAENERLRMQLAACGVLAGCNTPDSLERNRQMQPDFLCSSVQAVIEAVQREIKLIDEVRRLRVIEATSKNVYSEMDAALDWHTSPHIYKQWVWALTARSAEMAEAALAAKEKA